jgi:hypothetical protein
MDLMVDRRDDLKGAPACHALIVGVSAYPHLLGGTGPPAPENLQMTQLSCGASSANRVSNWLIKHQDRLAVPLATSRVLLSPSPAESVPPCAEATIANLLAAAAEWRADVATHRDGIAFFYFAGHGFELTSTEQVVLLSDFGNGIGPLLRGTVSVNNVFYGMAPTSRTSEIARTQVFFLDTGRSHRQTLPNFERQNTTALFDADLATLDDRRAGVFYASAPGGNAMAVPGKHTVFSAALLDCLNGAAATVVGENDVQEPTWGITLYSLAERLPRLVDEMSRRLNCDRPIIATVGGSLGPGVLCYTDGPPPVDVSLQIEPQSAAAAARITVTGADGEVVWTALGQSSDKLKVPAGIYNIEVAFDPPSPPFVNRAQLKRATPPESTWRVRVV